MFVCPVVASFVSRLTKSEILCVVVNCFLLHAFICNMHSTCAAKSRQATITTQTGLTSNERCTCKLPIASSRCVLQTSSNVCVCVHIQWSSPELLTATQSTSILGVSICLSQLLAGELLTLSMPHQWPTPLALDRCRTKSKG